MQKALIPFLLASLAMLLPGCDSGGKYVITDDAVCFSYWTFSFGTINDTLPDVNPKTFKSICNWAGHDDKHVYFKSTLVDGADVSTIKHEKYPLLRDKNDYYYKGTAMHVANVDKFKVLKWIEDDLWAIDGTKAFYDTIHIESADISTFKVKCWNVAVDRNHVYRYGEILPLADPETYDEQWKDYYSRDKSHIWYMGTLLEDADYATFEVEKEQLAHDKHGYFYRGERISQIEKERIEKQLE